ncbi:MAG: GtrA family protein [Oscillospiraceae bacterium]|nr:GtrA family protein [Oscillospiraceae bacterium]
MQRIKQLFEKYREIIMYLVFGVLTFLVSVLTYALFNVGFQLNELIANVISWIFAVTFAYITNRIWVFQSRAYGARNVILEILRFFGGRVFTLIVEELILYIFITRMGYNSMLVKIAAQVIVIVLNYIISKLFVFRKKRRAREQTENSGE